MLHYASFEGYRPAKPLPLRYGIKKNPAPPALAHKAEAYSSMQHSTQKPAR